MRRARQRTGRLWSPDLQVLDETCGETGIRRYGAMHRGRARSCAIPDFACREMRTMLLERAYEGAPALLTGKHLTTVNEFTDQIPALRPELLAEARDRLLALGPLAETD